MVIRGYTDLYGNPCLRAVLPRAGPAFGTRPWPWCPT